MPQVYLGVDAGNSKTLATVVDHRGHLLGLARGGAGDIYGARTPQHAIDVVLDVCSRALDDAGSRVASVSSAAFRLAGVDWPEDEALWRTALDLYLDDGTSRSVKNDGFALLRCASPDGDGVAVSVGTGAAIAARGADGEEFVVSWWFQHYLGAAGLGSDALRAVMLAELDMGPATSLTTILLDFYGASTVEDLLQMFTRREGALTHHDKGRAARLVIAQAGGGDEVASAIVDAHAGGIAEYIATSARRVHLTAPGVALGGSVLASPDSLLRRRVIARLDDILPDARVREVRGVPVLGCALDALAEGGVTITDELQTLVLGTRLSDEFLTT